MKEIFTRKISVQSSNPKYSYPLIRLPRELKELAGNSVHIYQTDYDDKLTFLVVVDKSVDKVSKKSKPLNVESRLSNLESSIDEIKSFFFKIIVYLIPIAKNREKRAPESGFEPESEPRQGPMIGHYTTRAA